MSHDNPDENDVRDESMSATTRRGLLGALGVAGLASLGSSGASAQIGGGPEADAMSEHRVPYYRVPESELDAPGVVGRRVEITSGGATYDTGDQLVDLGDRWALVSPNYGSVKAEKEEITDYLRATETRPTGYPQFAAPGATFHTRSVGTIAFETDDGYQETKDKAAGEFFDRGLPFGVCMDPGKIGQSNFMTEESVKYLASKGVEFSVHTDDLPGMTDADITTADDEDVREAVLGRMRQWWNDYNIMAQRIVPSNNPDFENLEDLRTFGGQVTMAGHNSVAGVKAFYGNSTGQGMLSTGGFTDSRQQIDGMTGEDVIDLIDRVADTGATLTLYFHPDSIDGTGLTTTELQNILDHAESKRDAGDLNITTPNQSRYLLGDHQNHDLVPYGGFETTPILADSPKPGMWDRSSTSTVINNSTANTGSNSLEIAPGDEVRFNIGIPPQINHFVVECHARAKGAGTTTGLRTWTKNESEWENMGASIPFFNNRSLTDSWSKQNMAGGIPVNHTAARLVFSTPADGVPALVDDVSIYYV